jgi:hypothetical protein
VVNAFTVAPCISMIHPLLVTNKCTKILTIQILF